MSAIKERPILFSGPMVRAILDGRKTVTRRAMKAQPHEGAMVTVERFNTTVTDRQGNQDAGPEVFGAWWSDGECSLTCPYGQPGDRLWVREAWSDVNMCGAPALAYCADEDVRDLMAEELFLDDDGAFNYQDKRWNKYPFCDWYADLHLVRWRPSIHMPRWASRILLEITAVRIERLQDISEEQAKAEGVRQMRDGSETWVGREGPGKLVTPWPTAKESFSDLWESINGEGSWRTNPWVWCIEFARIHQA